jgi:hypothetical protein
MPCKTCHELFVITPCKHSTGIFTKELLKRGHESVAELTHYYLLLKERCPCKECLIKMMCLEGDQCRVSTYVGNVYVEYFTPTRTSELSLKE